MKLATSPALNPGIDIKWTEVVNKGKKIQPLFFYGTGNTTRHPGELAPILWVAGVPSFIYKTHLNLP